MSTNKLNKVHLFRANDFDKKVYDKLCSFFDDVAKNYNEKKIIFKYEEEVQIPNNKIEEFYIDIIDAKKQISLITNSPEFRYNSNIDIESSLHHLISKKQKVVSWETLFNLCNSIRKNNKKIKKQDQVIILTNTANYKNYFSANDDFDKNGFVHTDLWDIFLPGYDIYLPIAYEVIGLIVHSNMGCTYTEIEEKIAHDESIGCISDMCCEKTKINIKIRTGDICSSCIKILNNYIDFNSIYLLLMYLNDIRKETLWTTKYLNINEKISAINLIIRQNNIEINFIDYNKEMNNLKPLQKAIYAYLLLNEEGLPENLNDLTEEQEENLTNLYQKVARGKRKEEGGAADTIIKQFTRNMIGTREDPKYQDPPIWGVIAGINKLIREFVKGEIPLKQYEINKTINENGISVYRVGLDRDRITEIRN